MSLSLMQTSAAESCFGLLTAAYLSKLHQGTGDGVVSCDSSPVKGENPMQPKCYKEESKKALEPDVLTRTTNGQIETWLPQGDPLIANYDGPQW